MRNTSLVVGILFLALSRSATAAEAPDEDASASPAKPAAAAPAPSAVPTPSAWVKELQAKDLLKSKGDGAYPSTVLFLEDTPKEGLPVFAKVDPAAFNKLGFLRTPPQKEIDFLFAINKRPTAKDAKISKSRDQWLTILLEATSADTVVFMSKKGPWEIIQLQEGKPTALLEAEGAPERKPSAVHQWLIQRLGYSGVILDRKGSHFLIGALQNIPKDDTQALVVKESSEQFNLKAANTDGAGLLQLVSREAGFGVFELLLGDRPENIATGTKIMMETKKESKGSAPKKSGASPSTKKSKTAGSPADKDE